MRRNALDLRVTYRLMVLTLRDCGFDSTNSLNVDPHWLHSWFHVRFGRWLMRAGISQKCQLQC